MTLKSLKPVLLSVAALLGTGAGLALPATAQAQPYVSVQVGPPPPPRMERVPAQRPGYVWAPGHYEWRRGAYVWMGGHWVRARSGYAYAAPVWVQRGGQWVYQPGRWDRDRGVRRHGRDRDGDGVRNRYDRHPNNPYRH